ncbi:HTTM domain-containing protein [Aphanothece sacrum]|uniref:Type I deoxyribonuclease HsdR n=1 Tax=Aphanothece sacrum FPU1 TaxID=1920663 RepID=A0A401IJH1_APHSA|nr:HTTM domain-containing protein [Aphanothece sacrum]GBF81409.1 type I deoxyribonuclease HsdR [Aphanothece sacrum FPU1]GBF85400.1 type I deoxyribonuclease HsdR [Aphanothece sacrum FPU3]
MSISSLSWKQIFRGWNIFFHQPINPQICDIIRIFYSFLLLINLLVLLPDLNNWFGENGLLPYSVSREIIDPDTLTIFMWLPKNNDVLWLCYGIFVSQIILLLIGLFSRFQAICVFIWFVSFVHRHHILFDAEDTLFRLIGFFLIFMPIGTYYSLDNCLNTRKGYTLNKKKSTWALRLLQIQMSLIYFSTVWEKMKGEDWVNGTAIYYVSHLDDLFGHFPVPQFLFTSLTLMKIMTWIVLVVELFIPIGLWFKETRRFALLIAVGMHLSLEYAMNLFLFQWLMLVGLLSFTEPEDFKLIKHGLNKIKTGLTKRFYF